MSRIQKFRPHPSKNAHLLPHGHALAVLELHDAIPLDVREEQVPADRGVGGCISLSAQTHLFLTEAQQHNSQCHDPHPYLPAVLVLAPHRALKDRRHQRQNLVQHFQLDIYRHQLAHCRLVHPHDLSPRRARIARRCCRRSRLLGSGPAPQQQGAVMDTD